MHHSTPRLSPKQYCILGRLCATQKPEIAQELFSVYNIQPTEQNLTRIPEFFIKFCSSHGIKPDDYRGNLFKSRKTDQRRLFIACIVRMYMPHLHELPAGSVRVNHGIAAALAKILGQKQPNISNMIREVVVHEKAYPEFKADVDQLTHKMMTT